MNSFDESIEVVITFAASYYEEEWEEESEIHLEIVACHVAARTSFII